MEGDLHVDVSRVGDNLTATAGDLEAAEEAKVDPLPDPGARRHRHVQCRADHHRVVAQQAHAQAFLIHLDRTPPAFKEYKIHGEIELEIEIDARYGIYEMRDKIYFLNSKMG